MKYFSSIFWLHFILQFYIYYDAYSKLCKCFYNTLTCDFDLPSLMSLFFFPLPIFFPFWLFSSSVILRIYLSFASHALQIFIFQCHCWISRIFFFKDTILKPCSFLNIFIYKYSWVNFPRNIICNSVGSFSLLFRCLQEHSYIPSVFHYRFFTGVMSPTYILHLFN